MSERMFRGNPFQSLEALTEKALSAMREENERETRWEEEEYMYIYICGLSQPIKNPYLDSSRVYQTVTEPSF